VTAPEAVTDPPGRRGGRHRAGGGREAATPSRKPAGSSRPRAALPCRVGGCTCGAGTTSLTLRLNTAGAPTCARCNQVRALRAQERHLAPVQNARPPRGSAALAGLALLARRATPERRSFHARHGNHSVCRTFRGFPTRRPAPSRASPLSETMLEQYLFIAT